MCDGAGTPVLAAALCAGLREKQIGGQVCGLSGVSARGRTNVGRKKAKRSPYKPHCFSVCKDPSGACVRRERERGQGKGEGQ